ncbi:MAG: hypothetical protein LKJ88_00375 [Bacilli bacterium]|nr:hypothetical protein [Bacilli bacterium]
MTKKPNMRFVKFFLILSIINPLTCLPVLKLLGDGMVKGPFRSSYIKKIIKKHPYQDFQSQIVFYGASNFRLWTDMETDLKEYKVINCGFGGATDATLVEFADRLLFPYNPRMVFFQTGSNDYVSLKGTSEEKIKKCMEYKDQMFTSFHQRLPNSILVVMSGLLLPGRKEFTGLTQQINEELKAYCQSHSYMRFVQAEKMTFDGRVYFESLFRKDLIHLNHEGELKWMREYIKPEIDKLIEENHFEDLKNKPQGPTDPSGRRNPEVSDCQEDSSSRFA